MYEEYQHAHNPDTAPGVYDYGFVRTHVLDITHQNTPLAGTHVRWSVHRSQTDAHNNFAIVHCSLDAAGEPSSTCSLHKSSSGLPRAPIANLLRP
ncbi:MAG TPA: hypothetical protein VGC79_17070 [Polyangiaceae bacterium]